MLIGPLTFLLLGKCAGEEFDRLELLDSLVEVYAEVLAELGKQGAEWVQIDEPVLVQDRTPDELEALERAYERLAAVEGAPKIVVATYFDHVGEALPGARAPAGRRHRARLRRGERNRELIARARLARGQDAVRGRRLRAQRLDQRPRAQPRRCSRTFSDAAGEQLVVSTSCSLLHSPIDKRNEPRLDDEVLSWMSFAVQKLDEVAALDAALNEGEDASAPSSTRTARRSRAAATRRAPAIRRCASGSRRSTDADAQRQSAFADAARGSARAARAAALPDDDDRLLPADRRHPPGADAAAQGRDRRAASTST